MSKYWASFTFAQFGEKASQEGFYIGIQDSHCIVIALSLNGYAVFRTFKAVLELQERFVCLKLGVALLEHKEPGDRTFEIACRLCLVVYGLCREIGFPGICQRFEHSFFICCIAFYRFDKVGNKVETTLELSFNLSPLRLSPLRSG